ncbi:MAG: glycosyltransferase family 2 protein [Gammaproteobacteria bacterium]
MSSVDVIVPCYRYAHFLRECVESVLSQSILDVRVLILDDASPDNTADVAADLAREDNRVVFVRHAANKGHIATYNEGIEWASADYLLLLSADDYLLPGALSRATEIMDKHLDVGFSYGRVIELTDSDPAGRKKTVGNVSSERGASILAGRRFIELSGSCNIVPTPTAVVRTALQKKVGLYRPYLPHSGDMEMWLRLAAHASVASLEAHQAVYRRHSNNMSLAYYRNNCLPDLQHRKAALDSFFQSCSGALIHDRKLQRQMHWSLGCKAIGFASAAFNDDEMDLADQISHFALSVCPEVKMSFPWAKLACKRRLGSQGWRTLQAVRAKWF